jgi:hypothetical protein
MTIARGTHWISVLPRDGPIRECACRILLFHSLAVAPRLADPDTGLRTDLVVIGQILGGARFHRQLAGGRPLKIEIARDTG